MAYVDDEEMSLDSMTEGESRTKAKLALWEDPGVGVTDTINLERNSVNGTTQAHDEEVDDESLIADASHSKHKLGQLLATSISGNDITSSVLYVIGVSSYYAGFWAPVALFLVSGVVLYLFRGIYSEVVTALPVNGGTYTVLLNTTSKKLASLAACLTLLSYVATAVVSASVAVNYLAQVWTALDQSLGTVALLVIFAVLNFCGLKDSARVAAIIFVAHMTIMGVLIVDCTRAAINDKFNMLHENFLIRNDVTNYSPGKALFFGFASAMLGVTGFETSANYVEEQQPGVFVKTLRNMWYSVAILNPVISFLALCTVPLDQIMGTEDNPNQHLLQDMTSHDWLKTTVNIDAFLVLAGSVLTSYVGFTGLVVRMSLDRCLPESLTKRNSLFRTHHYIIFGFCAVCTSLYFITDRNVLVLSSVYAIAFLCVMTLFAVGNLILKYKRSRIRRDFRARVPVVLLALSAVIIAIFGNIMLNQSTMVFFVLYYGITLAIVGGMFQRVRIMKMTLQGILGKGAVTDQRQLLALQGYRGWVARFCYFGIKNILSQSCAFFIKGCDIRLMSKAIEYVRDNELCEILKFVNVYSPNYPPNKDEFEADIKVLQRIFPKMRLDMIFVETNASFDGNLIRTVGDKLDVPTHLVFISCPSEKFPYSVASLGGVRLITH